MVDKYVKFLITLGDTLGIPTLRHFDVYLYDAEPEIAQNLRWVIFEILHNGYDVFETFENEHQNVCIYKG